VAFFGVEPEEFERFSKDVLSKINSLEGFVSLRISELEKEINLKATDSEVQARAAADSALEIEKSIAGIGANVRSIFNDLEVCKNAEGRELDEIQGIRNSLEIDTQELAAAIATVRSAYDDFSAKKNEVDSAIAETYGDLSDLNKILAGKQALDEQINTISTLFDKSSEAHKNISGLLNHSLKKKSEIDELYNSVFGYEIKGEDGEVQAVDGLYDELNTAYEDVKNGLEGVSSVVAGVVREVEDKYRLELEGQKKDFDAFILNSKEIVNSVDNKLKGLLPGSMAAGLSAAYEEKKREEEKSQEAYSENFKYAIGAMVAISLIPFGVDVFLLFGKNLDIVEVVKGTPNLIVSILPLYFPVLWFAFSTNKKLNLSKRLIEEYTHKAVLGKTFSGLSNQIESLSHERAVKDELREKLLFNMLQVSSENPGKLITDYNKSDHPFMEALENSSKLGGAIEALSKLPGFSALADKLSRKAQDIVESQSKKVEAGLGMHEAFEPKSGAAKPEEAKA